MNEETMLHQSPGETTTSIAIRYGLIVGIISIIYSLILNITDLSITNQSLSYISFIIIIVGIVLAHKHYKRENNGFMSYGQGLGIGSLLSAIVGLLSGVFAYIYMTFVDEDFMSKMQDVQTAKLEQQGLSDEQIEQAIQMTEKFTGPVTIFLSAVLGTLFIGFLLSLVISAFTKNSKPEFE